LTLEVRLGASMMRRRMGSGRAGNVGQFDGYVEKNG
jgi:hypothetical protein